MMINLGRSIAISRYGAETLGLTAELEDLGSLGIDPELFRFKVGTSKQAMDLVRQGMLQELRDGGLLYGHASLTPDDRTQLDNFAAEVESMDVAQLADVLKLSPDSQFRSLSVAVTHAENLASRIANFQNASFRAISSSRIDAFYFGRQGTLLPKQLEEAGEFIQQGFMQDYISNIKDFKDQIKGQETVMDRARLSMATEMLNTKYMEQIRQATHSMRSMPGYENIDALDIADAIEVSEVMTRSGVNRMSLLSTSIADEAGQRFPDLKKLFDLAQLRRDYFSVSTSSDYVSGQSETYRIHQIMDNALSMMGAGRRTRQERLLGGLGNEPGDFSPEGMGSVDAIKNFLFGLAGTDEQRRAALGGRNRTLDEVLGGIMSPDEFRAIIGTRGERITDASVLGRGSMALAQNEDDIASLLSSLVSSGAITEEQQAQTLGRVRRSRTFAGQFEHPKKSKSRRT